MARQVRIEYPGAFYHVFSRGNQRQPVFLTDEDRYFFLKGLRVAHQKFGVIIHAFCLMPNHFHLIVETPLGNLSRMMHFLITSYTIYFNKKHERHGHLFQGRFRSVLIEAVTYAQELSRYIHLNPVRAELVDRPEEYSWSSFKNYRGEAKREDWLETDVILRLFGDDIERSVKAYSTYVEQGVGADVTESIRLSIKRGILGSEAFIARIKQAYLAEECLRPDREKPQLRKLTRKPDISLALSVAEKVMGPRNRYLVPIIIYIVHKSTSLTLKEIGEFFDLSISGVLSARRRARIAMVDNAVLVNTVEAIEREIEKVGFGATVSGE